MAIKPIKTIPAEKRRRPEYLADIQAFLASGSDAAEVIFTGGEDLDECIKVSNGLRQTIKRKFPGQMKVRRVGYQLFLQRVPEEGGHEDA